MYVIRGQSTWCVLSHPRTPLWLSCPASQALARILVKAVVAYHIASRFNRYYVPSPGHLWHLYVLAGFDVYKFVPSFIPSMFLSTFCSRILEWGPKLGFQFRLSPDLASNFAHHIRFWLWFASPQFRFWISPFSYPVPTCVHKPHALSAFMSRLTCALTFCSYWREYNMSCMPYQTRMH